MKCPYCQQEITPGIDNCKNCGADLSKAAVTEMNTTITGSNISKTVEGLIPQHKDKSSSKFIIIILIILGIIGFLYYKNNIKNNENGNNISINEII